MTGIWWIPGAILVVIVAVMCAWSARAGVVQGVDLVAPAPWISRIDAVERSLAAGDVSAAVYGWRDAYGEAARSRRWDALAAVGDAAARIDRAAGPASGFRAEARRAYLEALFRARTAGAVDGMRRVALAFSELGDGEMSARATEMAQTSTERRAAR